MPSELELQLIEAQAAQARAMRGLADAYLQKADATELVVKRYRELATQTPEPLRGVYEHRAAALEQLVVVCQSQAATCDKEADRVEEEVRVVASHPHRAHAAPEGPHEPARGLPEATGAP